MEGGKERRRGRRSERRPAPAPPTGSGATQLTRIREHFRVVTRLMAGALLVTDRQGVIRMLNPATVRILGYEEDELVGQPVEVLFPGPGEPGQPGIATLVAHALEGRPVERIELEAVTKAGERVPVAVAACPSRTADGDVIGAVLVGTDLREVRRLLREAERAEAEHARAAEVGQAYQELKAFQERLVHAEKMASLDRLSAGVAHEINNPLGGILAYAHLLKERLSAADPRSHGYLDIIIREATRCRDIVRGLLDFARVSKGEPGLFDVNDVVRDALALLSQQSLFHDIEVTVHLAEHLPRVRVDRNHMQQAFFNIIYNAAQAMTPSGGRLDIDTWWDTASDRVSIRFADTGPGIPEEIRSQIFEPFFTTKDIGEGTGLGLAVVRGIIDQHGGTVRVHSTPGAGAVFTIDLPAAPAEGHEVRRPA